MTQTELASARDIAKIIGLSAERTRVILSKMDDVEPVGENRNLGEMSNEEEYAD